VVGKSRTALIGLVVIVAAINIVQFRSIDSETTSRYRALEREGTSDIMDIGLGSPELSRVYRFYLELSEIAPRSHLLLLESDQLSLITFGDLALSIGDAESIRAISSDERDSSLEGTTGRTVISASGVGNFGSATDIEWNIVTRNCYSQPDSVQSRTFVLAFGPEGREGFLSATEVCAFPDVMSTE